MSAPFETLTYEDPKVTFTRYNPETACPLPQWVQPPMKPIVHAPQPRYPALGGLRPMSAYSPAYLRSQWFRQQNSYR